MFEKGQQPKVIKLDKEKDKELFVLIDHYIAEEISKKLSTIIDKLNKLEGIESKLITIENQIKLLGIEIKDKKI